jgi:hypothetical protein
LKELNYFSLLCFAWAFIGMGSRLVMIYFSKQWAKWELEKVYTEEKPRWIYPLALFAVGLVAFTWYKVFTEGIAYSWIIASMVTFTLFKIFNLAFNYSEFRNFVKDTLGNKKKLLQLNVMISIFSIICLMMGVFLY